MSSTHLQAEAHTSYALSLFTSLLYHIYHMLQV